MDLSAYLSNNFQDILPKLSQAHTTNLGIYEFHANDSLYTTSRNLSNTFSQTINGYYSAKYYNLLRRICDIQLNSRITFYGATSTFTEASAVDIDTFSQMSRTQRTRDDYSIVLWYIPSGKSYIYDLLKNEEFNQKYKQEKGIQANLTQSNTHFIKVFDVAQNERRHKQEILIITDKVNTKLIDEIFIMLPNLIKDLRLTAEEMESNEKTSLHKLRNIFEELYMMHAHNKELPTKTFVDLVNTFFDEFDMISTGLESFTTKLKRAGKAQKIEQLEYDLKNVEQEIKNAYELLERYYVKKRTKELEHLALVNADETDTKLFLTALEQQKEKIKIISATQDELLLQVTAPLKYYVPEDLKAYISSQNSTYRGYIKADTALDKLMQKIILDNEYKFMLQGIFRIYFSNSTQSGINIEAVRSTDKYNVFPNPHVYHHNCFGKARDEINKALVYGNYDLIPLQLITVVQSINLAENASFINGFVYDITNNNDLKNKVIIVDSENKELTLNEALERMDPPKEIETTVTLKTQPAYTQTVLEDTPTPLTTEEITQLTVNTTLTRTQL